MIIFDRTSPLLRLMPPLTRACKSERRHSNVHSQPTLQKTGPSVSYAIGHEVACASSLLRAFWLRVSEALNSFKLYPLFAATASTADVFPTPGGPANRAPFASSYGNSVRRIQLCITCQLVHDSTQLCKDLYGAVLKTKSSGALGRHRSDHKVFFESVEHDKALSTTGLGLSCSYSFTNSFSDNMRRPPLFFPSRSNSSALRYLLPAVTSRPSSSLLPYTKTFVTPDTALIT